MGPSGYLFLHPLWLAIIKEAGPWKMLLSPICQPSRWGYHGGNVCVATLMYNRFLDPSVECCRYWFPNIHQMHRSATDIINSSNETMDWKAWVTPSITSVPELFLQRWLEIYLSPIFGFSFIFFFFCRYTAASARVTCLKWWFILNVFFIQSNLICRDFFASEFKCFMYIHDVLDRYIPGRQNTSDLFRAKVLIWELPFALCMAWQCRWHTDQGGGV